MEKMLSALYHAIDLRRHFRMRRRWMRRRLGLWDGKMADEWKAGWRKGRSAEENGKGKQKLKMVEFPQIGI